GPSAAALDPVPRTAGTSTSISTTTRTREPMVRPRYPFLNIGRLPGQAARVPPEAWYSVVPLLTAAFADFPRRRTRGASNRSSGGRPALTERTGSGVLRTLDFARF